MNISQSKSLTSLSSQQSATGNQPIRPSWSRGRGEPIVKDTPKSTAAMQDTFDEAIKDRIDKPSPVIKRIVEAMVAAEAKKEKITGEPSKLDKTNLPTNLLDYLVRFGSPASGKLISACIDKWDAIVKADPSRRGERYDALMKAADGGLRSTLPASIVSKIIERAHDWVISKPEGHGPGAALSRSASSNALSDLKQPADQPLHKRSVSLTNQELPTKYRPRASEV